MIRKTAVYGKNIAFFVTIRVIIVLGVEMRLKNTFAKHESQPDKSADSYLKELKIDLGQELRNTTKVYLDTKYWILLRDSRRGCKGDSQIDRLYQVLLSGVQSGKIICPISDYLYAEIMGQTDFVTLLLTAQLIDELSKGVSLVSSDERLRTEILHWLYTCLKGKGALYSLKELVWTKLAFALGHVYPTNTGLPEKEQTLMQKVFLDQIWSSSITEMLHMIGPDSAKDIPRFSDITPDLNEGKIKYAYQNSSFKQVFMSELGGVIDLIKPQLEEIVVYMYQKETGQVSSNEELQLAESSRWLANAIYNAFRLNKFKKELPTLRIGAGLHASVRWDISRKFHKNDMADFGHAQAALPYCDYFLTERNLCDLIKKNNLSYDRLYDCKVISDVEEAIDALADLTGVAPISTGHLE